MKTKRILFDSFPEGKKQLIKYLYKNNLGTVWYRNDDGTAFTKESDKLSNTIVILIFKPEKECVCCGRKFYGDPMDKVMAIDGDFCEDWTNAPFPEEAYFLNMPADFIGYHFHHPIFWWRFD